MRLVAAIALAVGSASCTPNPGGFGNGNTIPGASTGTAESGTAATHSTTGPSSSTGLLDTGSTLDLPSSTDDTASTTSASSSTGEASESSGGPLPPLVDTGLLARWYLDEANKGQESLMAADAAPMPLDLALMYRDSLMTFTEVDGNRGLRWPGLDDDGRAIATIAGTKLESILAPSTQVTIEMVLGVDALDDEMSRLVHIGSGSGTSFALATEDLDLLRIRWGGDIAARRFDVNFTSDRQVLHVVFDTDQAEPNDRILAYVNGEALSLQSANKAVPDQGESIPAAPTASFVLGNRSDGMRSFEGHLDYAAIYLEPLSPADVLTNATVLIENDDTP